MGRAGSQRAVLRRTAVSKFGKAALNFSKAAMSPGSAHTRSKLNHGRIQNYDCLIASTAHRADCKHVFPHSGIHFAPAAVEPVAHLKELYKITSCCKGSLVFEELLELT